MVRKSVWICFLLGCFAVVVAQPNHKPSSVLASGDWYKLNVEEGVYKIEITPAKV
jgi:hypothetical protein